MTSRKKIPPASKQSRSYSPGDPRYERNARLQALEERRAVQVKVVAEQPPPAVEDITYVETDTTVSIGGALVGTQPGLDFVAGAGVTLTGQDASNQGRVIITVNAQTTVLNLTLTGAQDDLTHTDLLTGVAILRLTPTESLRISGIVGGTDGRTLRIVNASADYTVLLTRDDPSSAAANRFYWSHANPVFLMPGDAVSILYDGTTARWRMADSNAASLQAQLPTFTDCNAGAGDDYALTASGTAATGASGNYLVDGTGKAHGVFQLTTGTDATGRAFLACGNVESVSPGDGPALFVTRLAVEDLSDGTDTFQVFAGFMDAQSSSDVSNGCYWYYHFS